MIQNILFFTCVFIVTFFPFVTHTQYIFLLSQPKILLVTIISQHSYYECEQLHHSLIQ